jgi:hypothetical protein
MKRRTGAGPPGGSRGKASGRLKRTVAEVARLRDVAYDPKSGDFGYG